MSVTRANQKSLIKKSMKLSMDESNLASYQDIKDKIRPYDIIGFRGGDIISDLISTLEKHKLGVGAFSHVGMVVTSDILPYCKINGKDIYLKPNHPYIFESTFSYSIGGITDGIPDITTGKCKFGVQLRDLEELIPRYITGQGTKVAWCKLLNNPFDRIGDESDEDLKTRRAVLCERFERFFHDYEGRMYEISPESLLAAMFPTLRIVRNIRDMLFIALYKELHKFGLANIEGGPAGWQFCSELIANVYQSINVIPKEFNPKDVLPVDFFGCDEDGLPSLVEPPVYIKDWDLPDQPAINYNTKKEIPITSKLIATAESQRDSK